MFYKKGIDICNDKSMFNFLKDHDTYFTMSSWNGLESIANNVKIYNLDLEGDEWVAYDLLCADDYSVVNLMLKDWEDDHPGYRVGFNGRSGGYIVLYNSNNYRNVLPNEIAYSDDYEEFKRWCKEDCVASLREYRPILVNYVKLVQDFDKLCDKIRDYVNELSKQDPAIDLMVDVVQKFNDEYWTDLEALEINLVQVNDDGTVDLAEVGSYKCLFEAFINIVNHTNTNYKLVHVKNDIYKLEK